jgi:hypothetical protein
MICEIALELVLDNSHFAKLSKISYGNISQSFEFLVVQVFLYGLIFFPQIGNMYRPFVSLKKIQCQAIIFFYLC